MNIFENQAKTVSAKELGVNLHGQCDLKGHNIKYLTRDDYGFTFHQTKPDLNHIHYETKNPAGVGIGKVNLGSVWISKGVEIKLSPEFHNLTMMAKQTHRVLACWQIKELI